MISEAGPPEKRTLPSVTVPPGDRRSRVTSFRSRPAAFRQKPSRSLPPRPSQDRSAGTVRTQRQTGRPGSPSVWGRLEKTAQPAACHTGTPRGTSTKAIQPLRNIVYGDGCGDKDPQILAATEGNPDPDALGKGVIVMTPTIISAFWASAPFRSLTSGVSIQRAARTTRASPMAIPSNDRQAPIAFPSEIKLWLAASIKPAATAAPMASGHRSSLRRPAVSPQGQS